MDTPVFDGWIPGDLTGVRVVGMESFGESLSAAPVTHRTIERPIGNFEVPLTILLGTRIAIQAVAGSVIFAEGLPHGRKIGNIRHRTWIQIMSD